VRVSNRITPDVIDGCGFGTPVVSYAPRPASTKAMSSVDMTAAKRVDLAISIPTKYEKMFGLLFELYGFERKSWDRAISKCLCLKAEKRFIRP